MEKCTRVLTRQKATAGDAGGVKKIDGMIPFSQSEVLTDTTGIPAAVLPTLRAAGGKFREVIAAGAFNFSANVSALANHEASPVYGTTAGGNLQLTQGPEGLAIRLNLPANNAGDGLYKVAKSGGVTGISFEFSVNPGGEDWDFSARPPVRTLRSITISEVSFLTNQLPAYPNTSVAARAKAGGEWHPDPELLSAIAQGELYEAHQFPADIAADEAREAAAAKRALPTAEPLNTDPSYWLARFEREAESET
jgi:uncharacterized protein